ncbi:MAG: uroporphyrinogen-III synthase [Gammaproteobacteria bacterium]|uniref:uroporphyrinogen-III synthase n=1 Tax=Rhodoferax sp. TaxID=50421 RepID=UPI0017D0C0EF|nr:uroporphyrinogen-III synthase [Rhodoferax sp.]MBU3898206.1 uroporphyrinogen-III synthase [Gammaproteobacteria bacterium]MBA3057870.1 uroporphyrinogen-III synthase [Rhodoferax sp.]MBU3996512.1 uroporphyrinogen-III synthase [Gammaproteobacteria bacterium]MBU4019021.1 uroporphyrinogen-III synthase [Gammaproteobacteria bacterium]MBU4081641.1 uroporphyrinogen-III synthase [Gammaproteobacteria bacterium]
MRVIVTRPEREALRWVHDLSEQGLPALALPLIEVRPVDDPADLRQAWQQLDDYVGLMFVSANAVDYFFRSNPALAHVIIAQEATKIRAWATGPGTTRALLRQGIAPEQIDAPPLDAGQFDSEALWQVVGPQVQPGARVLIVRGGDSLGAARAKAHTDQGSGREWFANQVRQVGGQAEFVMAYQRSAPAWGSAQRTLALQGATDGSVWLFSSTEAVSNLRACLPDQVWAGARALATHPRIAAAAQQAGFGLVQESRPTLPELVACLKRMQQTAF